MLQSLSSEMWMNSLLYLQVESPLPSFVKLQERLILVERDLLTSLQLQIKCFLSELFMCFKKPLGLGHQRT